MKRAVNDPAPVAPGIYRHYKGQRYRVLGLARHSETMETMVVYRALYGEAGLWVRPAAMFAESIDVNGTATPRFALEEAGVDATDHMLSDDPPATAGMKP